MNMNLNYLVKVQLLLLSGGCSSGFVDTHFFYIGI